MTNIASIAGRVRRAGGPTEAMRRALTIKNRTAYFTARSVERARVEYKAGRLVPYRITQALDLAHLEGPDVDVQLGGVEPMVDEWEAGTRYPTWDQVLALAKLTGFGPAYFTTEVDPEEEARWRESTFICAQIGDEEQPLDDALPLWPRDDELGLESGCVRPDSDAVIAWFTDEAIAEARA